jgi:hypothetical protein
MLTASEMIVSKELGKLISEIKGEDSFGQAAIKTQVSKAYLIEIAAGKVPRPEILEQFLIGYKVKPCKAKEIYEAAGYYLPTHWVEDLPETAMTTDNATVYVRIEGEMDSDKEKRTDLQTVTDHLAITLRKKLLDPDICGLYIITRTHASARRDISAQVGGC